MPISTYIPFKIHNKRQNLTEKFITDEKQKKDANVESSFIPST